MASLLDLEFIKKWVNISDEELMQRLVKDAVGLQKEAEANKRAADIAKRKADKSYTMDMIKRFFRQYNYLSQYFSDKEIETAVKIIWVSEILPLSSGFAPCQKSVL